MRRGLPLPLRRGLGTTRSTWSCNIPRQHAGEVTLWEYADRIGAHRQTVYGSIRRGYLRGGLPSSAASASGS